MALDGFGTNFSLLVSISLVCDALTKMQKHSASKPNGKQGAAAQQRCFLSL